MDKLLEILKKADEYAKKADRISAIETQNRELQKQNENLKSDNREIKRQNVRLLYILFNHFHTEPCPNCHGEGGRDDGHGDGGMCEFCQGSGWTKTSG